MRSHGESIDSLLEKGRVKAPYRFCHRRRVTRGCRFEPGDEWWKWSFLTNSNESQTGDNAGQAFLLYACKMLNKYQIRVSVCPLHMRVLRIDESHENWFATSDNCEDKLTNLLLYFRTFDSPTKKRKYPELCESLPAGELQVLPPVIRLGKKFSQGIGETTSRIDQ